MAEPNAAALVALREALLPLADTLDEVEGPVILAWTVDRLAERLAERLSETGYTLTPPPPDCPSCGQRPGQHRMSCPIGGPI